MTNDFGNLPIKNLPEKDAQRGKFVKMYKKEGLFCNNMSKGTCKLCKILI